MADVAHGHRVVAGHDQVSGQGQSDRDHDLLPRQIVKEVDDVVVAVVGEGALQDAQRHREQDEDEERLQKRHEPSEAVRERLYSIAIQSGTPWAALCLAASMSWT